MYLMTICPRFWLTFFATERAAGSYRHDIIFIGYTEMDPSLV